MAPLHTLLSGIRNLIADDKLDAALQQLRTLLDNSPQLDEAIHQTARYKNIRKQIRLGTVSHEEATLTQNQIRAGLLDFLREIEEQGAKPELKEEIAQAVQVVNSKNVVIGSTIQAGGNVVIGDTTTITESPTSRRWRWFLFVFVPVLAIALALLGYKYQVLQRPLQLKVRVENRTPNPELPNPSGALTLTFGPKTDTLKNVSTEALFEGIPANFRGEQLRLQYSAKGFVPVDTLIVLKDELFVLQVQRDDYYAKITGFISDESGNPLPDVEVSISSCCSTQTDANGAFSLPIPPDHQRSRQRLGIFKKGFDRRDITTPVVPNEPLRLILQKE